MALMCVVFVLGACADDDGDRRFANDPIPTEDMLARPTVSTSTRAPEPTESPATPATTAQLLGSVGPAARVYIQIGAKIVAIPVAGGAAGTVLDARKDQIVAFAGSPDGERVAVLTAGNTTESLTIRILDSSGDETVKAELPRLATPTGGGFGRYRLAWSPVGDRLLLTLETGGILDVLVTGEVRTILGPGRAPSPRAVAWSPTGGSIAYVDAGPNGTATGLYVATADVFPVDPVAVIRPLEGRSRQIQEIACAPGDTGILFSERSNSGDLSVGGDLFAVATSGGAPVLVASAAKGAQAAAVGTFALSPDGTAIAFTVLQPGGGGTIDQQLYVQQMDGPSLIRLAGGKDDVSGLAWTAKGLSWSVAGSTGGIDRVTVQLAGNDGRVHSIYAEPPPASPVASPRADASPVGTPTGAITPASS